MEFVNLAFLDSSVHACQSTGCEIIASPPFCCRVVHPCRPRQLITCVADMHKQTLLFDHVKKLPSPFSSGRAFDVLRAAIYKGRQESCFAETLVHLHCLNTCEVCLHMPRNAKSRLQ